MRAKEMSPRCPVITQCRSHALAVGEPYGIWGGLSESERELLLKRGIRAPPDRKRTTREAHPA